jgi:predicted exporter
VLLLSSPSLAGVVSADPTLASLRVIERLGAGPDMRASFPVGEKFGSLVIAETRAPPFELGGQRQALDRLEEAFAALGDERAALEVFGMGAYGLGVQETIRGEAMIRGIIATILVLVVLVAAFRKPAWAAAAGLPVALGFLAGLAALSLVFGRVHGITIAFGVTILGVTVDYPVHLLGHARRVGFDRALGTVMPAIWIGAASTAIAYLGLALTGSAGLAQLAVFSLTGVLVAATATRWLLPEIGLQLSRGVAGEAQPETARGNPPTSFLPVSVAVAIGLGLVLTQGAELWNDRLSDLTPIPAEVLQRDHELRQATGSPDPRYVIAVQGETRDAALAFSEKLDRALEDARGRGLIERWTSPGALLPSTATQRQRREALPSPSSLRRWLDTAVEGTPFSAGAFEPFLSDVAAASELELSPEKVLESPFGGMLESMLYEARGAWTATTTLHGPVDGEALAAWVQRAPLPGNVYVVDLKAASESLVARYRGKAAVVIGIAALAILALLVATERRLRRGLWIVSTAVAGLGLTVASVYALSGPLSVFHFVALLVVFGLGLDYGLFHSKPATESEVRDTRRSVLVCVASTCATFGVLAFSSIPVLSAIGTTVTAGCLLCWVLSRLGTATAR